MMKPAKSGFVCKQASVERVGRNELFDLWGLAPESAGAHSDEDGRGRGVRLEIGERKKIANSSFRRMTGWT
jgi:hypothetical protein